MSTYIQYMTKQFVYRLRARLEIFFVRFIDTELTVKQLTVQLTQLNRPLIVIIIIILIVTQ